MVPVLGILSTTCTMPWHLTALLTCLTDTSLAPELYDDAPLHPN